MTLLDFLKIIADPWSIGFAVLVGTLLGRGHIGRRRGSASHSRGLVANSLSLVAAVFSAMSPASAQTPSAALTGERTFQSAPATAAQRRYFDTLQRGRAAYLIELNAVAKTALAAGSLDDANAINELKKRLEAGAMPLAGGQRFKTASANDARLRFEKATAAAQRQYATDLQTALKAAMAGGQLDEANAITSEIKALAAMTPVTTLAPLGGPANARSVPGLLITRYPLHDSQKDGNRYEGYVPHTELGKPLGAPKTVRAISSWTKAVDENAVVSGLLRIDQPGTYQFQTDSGFDRNELLIDGKVVCKFRDRAKNGATVELRAGLIPIVSVGYAHSTTEVRIQWKPPGAEKFSDIPANLLSH